MHEEQARQLGALGAHLLRDGTRRVEEVHEGVSARVFRAVGPVGEPVRLWHDLVRRGSYASVRTGLGLAALAAGAVAARRVSGATPGPAGRTALRIANGTHGDLLARRAPALALDMTVRAHGSDVPLTTEALRVAFPRAGARVVVFLHGLTEDERSWEYRALLRWGAPGTTYGTLLERDLGITPLYLRYATGRRISDNGARLSSLLEQLAAAWPVPLGELVLVGHSMGGLVARSALHQAAGGTADALAWTHLVRETITLGTPHRGAPLERGAHRATQLLRRLPETRPFAVLLASRSVGIKDLGHGSLLEQDWLGRDPDAPYSAAPGSVPLHDGARHFVVSATLARNPEGRLGRLVGDLLVSPDSASGHGGEGEPLGFPVDHVHRVGGLHHLDLLNSPAVYVQLLRWLTPVPSGR